MKMLVNILLSVLSIIYALGYHHHETDTICPTILNRTVWRARNATTNILRRYPVPLVVIHHANSPSCSTLDECGGLCRSFQDFHMDTRGWLDIGYNFLIGGDGQVYEGRGWRKLGAHALNYNNKSLGICFIGTFINSFPTQKAVKAAKELVSCGVSIGEIATSYKIIGHRQVGNTECPGEALYKTIQTWPKWTSSEYENNKLSTQ